MEAVKIFEAITDLNKNMNEGFAAVYSKIDERFTVCDKRLGEVETIIAIKKALRERDQKNTDYWKWIVRAASTVGLASLMAIFWKLIIFGNSLP